MSETAFRIALVVLLVACNGFFAGAEVALVSVRPSRLRQMAEVLNRPVGTIKWRVGQVLERLRELLEDKTQ